MAIFVLILAATPKGSLTTPTDYTDSSFHRKITGTLMHVDQTNKALTLVTNNIRQGKANDTVMIEQFNLSPEEMKEWDQYALKQHGKYLFVSFTLAENSRLYHYTNSNRFALKKQRGSEKITFSLNPPLPPEPHHVSSNDR